MTTASWSETNEPEHFVQFCETDAFLVNSLSEFIGTALRQGDAGIVLATQSHRESLEERLKVDGLEVAAARLSGQYVSIDAAATLSKIMVDGSPDPGRFAEVIGSIITRAAEGRCHVRIFGELVALLWADGNRAAALRLEELWNELARTYSFSLFCAYRMQGFGGEVYEVEFTEICQQHSRVIPAESYTALASPDERLRVITLLQQKANSLEVEIAERKVAEEALKETEARLRFITESMPQKIFTAQPNGAIDYINPQWTEFTGLSFEEIRGWGWTQLIHPDDVEENIRSWQRSIDTGEPFYFEHRFRGADGVYRWHVTRAIPMRDAQGKIVTWIGSNTDIDEQKRLEERKDEFINMASHELKTPVTSLKGFTQVLQSRFKKRGDGETLRFLTIMDTQLNKLTKLINDLLDVSKMQHGKLDYREDLFDLNALVQEIVGNLQAGTSTHQLLIDGTTEVQVYGDRDRIGQVLINLLANAIKYSPKADMVMVHVSKDQENAIVSVQDFGIGIAAAHHGQVFERFYQVTDAEGKTYSGLGMGLYICAEIIKRHHGRIWVESTKDHGSTFSFTLPLREGKEGSFH